MRRRERFVGVAWLRQMVGQGGDGRTATRPPDGVGSVGALLEEINGRGYLVEIERDLDAYRVRCLPVRGRVRLGQPPLATSYYGDNLRSILASAAYELRQLASLSQDYEPSGTEVVRWVP